MYGWTDGFGDNSFIAGLWLYGWNGFCGPEVTPI